MISQAQIEQAVFTSACSREHDGYHLVASSPGVSAQDARDLVVWGPTHDSLADHCPASGSINFHALPSGRYCVSRTVASGFEYSNRGGQRIYTHCLLVPPGIMSRFAHNPFRIIEATSASGRLDVTEQLPNNLEAFPLIGRAISLDREALRWITSDLGPRRCAALVQTAISTPFTRIIAGPPPEQLLRALFSLLPPPCRREVSMSTGLRYSPRRPYRVMSLETDPGVRHRLAQLDDTVLFDLSRDSTLRTGTLRPWIQRVLETLRTEQWDQLADWYANLEEDVQTEDLDHIAAGWQCTARAAAPRQQAKPASKQLFQAADTPSETKPPRERRQTTQPLSTAAACSRRGVKPQPRSRRGTRQTETGAAVLLDLDHAALSETLEELDGAVLDAIHGVEGALDRVRTMWPQITSGLPSPLVSESRQQYVHYAVRSWQETPATTPRDPHRAVAALDVLATLFEGE